MYITKLTDGSKRIDPFPAGKRIDTAAGLYFEFYEIQTHAPPRFLAGVH